MILDLSNSPNARRYTELHGCTQFPICPGQWNKDYDLVMDELSPRARARVVLDAARAMRSNRRLLTSYKMPVGFDLERLPDGAVIRG